MSKKLNKLYKKTPSDFLEYQSEVPIDIYKIFSDMRIPIIEVNFDKLQKELPFENPLVKGLVYTKDENLFFLYSNLLKDIDIRFTLAHQLGHCCIHMNEFSTYHIELDPLKDIHGTVDGGYKFFNNQKEAEANKFARDLLIPTDQIMDILQHGDIENSEQLADMFKVSKELIFEKLYELSK